MRRSSYTPIAIALSVVCALLMATAHTAHGQALFRDPFTQQETVTTQAPFSMEPAPSTSVPSLGASMQDIFVTEPGAYFPPGESTLNALPTAQPNAFVPGGTPSTNLTAPRGVQSSRASGAPSGQDVESIDPGRLIRRERTDEDMTPSSAGNEVVTQNYPDGKKLLEKEVRQDEDGNYVNHGLWRVYDRNGRIQALGQFDMGRMVGVWKRIHRASDGGIFSERPFNMYNGPFLSVASFSDDQLDGSWIISDRNQQKIFEIQYKEGVRHGTAVWLYPSSARMRVATFKDGLLDGGLYEWNEEDQVTREEEYREGRRVIRRTTAYRPGVLSSESFFLDGRLELDGNDDWWEATPAPMRQTDEAYQNGPVNVWYSNGQPEMRGRYRDGERTGQFTWWHENGSKKGQGWFDDGLKTGRWIWWHDNGMKSIEGTYENDRMVGDWTWWHEDGRVRATEDKDADPTGGSYDDIFSLIDDDESDPQSEEDQQSEQGQSQSILTRDENGAGEGETADADDTTPAGDDRGNSSPVEREGPLPEERGPAEIGNTRVDPLDAPVGGDESPTGADGPPESPLVDPPAPETADDNTGVDPGAEPATETQGAEEIPPGTIVPDNGGQ